MYAKFPYGPLRIKKALGIFRKGYNKNPKNNNRRSDLGPFPGPKVKSLEIEGIERAPVPMSQLRAETQYIRPPSKALFNSMFS